MKEPVAIRQDGSRLVVDASVGAIPVLGLFFSLIGGVFVYGLLGGFVNLHEVEPWARGGRRSTRPAKSSGWPRCGTPW